jgi:hypothetical protein
MEDIEVELLLEIIDFDELLDVLETGVDDVGLLVLELLEVNIGTEEVDIVLTELLVAVL